MRKRHLYHSKHPFNAYRKHYYLSPTCTFIPFLSFFFIYLFCLNWNQTDFNKLCSFWVVYHVTRPFYLWRFACNEGENCQLSLTRQKDLKGLIESKSLLVVIEPPKYLDNITKLLVELWPCWRSWYWMFCVSVYIQRTL